MHIVGYESFDKNIDRAIVYDYIHERCEIEGGDGYHSTIKWHCDYVYADYGEAKEAIQRLDSGWYDDHAVLYYNRDKVAPTKAMQNILDRIEKIRARQHEYKDQNSVRNRVATYIGCPNCGSKLKKEYLRNEYCPLCRADLRSKTVLNKLGEYEAKVYELEEKYKELAKKQPGTIKWLVKYEFHC